MIDEASLAGWEAEDDVIDDALMSLGETVQALRRVGHPPMAFSEVWSAEPRPGVTLDEFLFGRAVPGVNRDARRLVGILLSKLAKWDDAMDLPSHLDAECGGVSIPFGPSICLASDQVGAGRGVACVAIGLAGRRGPMPVARSEKDSVAVHFVVDPADTPPFWRSLAELENQSDAELTDAAPLAFPALVFGPRAWPGTRLFFGRWVDIRPTLVRHLAGLNDHAPAVFSEFAEPDEIARRLSALASVDCSSESPRTRRNIAAMAERDAPFPDRVRRCEWHTKLAPTHNRIHFAVEGGVVYVGIFCGHLAT